MRRLRNRSRNRHLPLPSRCSALESLEPRQLLALTVATLPATDVTHDSATIGAEIVETAGASPELTVYWGDDDAGTFANDWDHVVHFKTSPVGQYTTDLDQLAVNTTYYYRALALSLFGGGLVWTEAASFSTLRPAAPTVASEPVQFVSGTTADLSGEVLTDGGETPNVSVYFGLRDAGEDVNAWDQSVDLGPQPGPFQVRLDSLLPDQTYYLRVAAANSGGAVGRTSIRSKPFRVRRCASANSWRPTARLR